VLRKTLLIFFKLYNFFSYCLEEVCRVIENLSKAMFVTFFPALITYDDSQGVEIMQNVGKASRRPRHDPNQRKGNMQARHNKDLCEACQHGCCFA
jgi:hypothetical protein